MNPLKDEQQVWLDNNDVTHFLVGMFQTQWDFGFALGNTVPATSMPCRLAGYGMLMPYLPSPTELKPTAL